MKKIKAVTVVIIVLTITLALSGLVGCGSAEETAGTAGTATAKTDVTTVSSSEIILLSQTADIGSSDLKQDWNDSATKIKLNGSDISVEGAGATAAGSVVTITKAGTYVCSGTLTNGQIFINATNVDKVHLVLNGADITNNTGAPIYAAQCDKLIVTLAEGTHSSLTDGGKDYKYADTANEEPNAALFSKDDLTINGTGTLVVNAGFNNGIGTKDDLLIVSGSLIVNAANHGLRGNDSVTVVNGDISITAGNDGIQTNNTKESDKGWVLIQGGKIAITAAHDGIQADTGLTITGGEFDITTGSGTSADTTSDSYKGLKSTADITITGGSFIINSTDDCIHANGNITVNGGSFSLASGDDGIHADGSLTVNSGNINVTKSYEGLEAANIVITGGTIDLVASDDGINAAGGADGSGMGGMFGKDQFRSGAGGAYSVNISGGSITLTAGGDGIDSNGSLDISGGTIISLINSSPDNGAIDCDGSVTFTGGAIIYGGTGTGSNPGGSSTQSYIYTDKGVKAGSEISIRQGGKTLVTFTPAMNCQYLAVSTPDISSGSSYDIYSGGSLLATVTAGTGGGGMMGGPGGGMRMPGQGGGQRPAR